MMASSMGAAPQGVGCDALIVDDPHNARRAESDTIRDFDIRMFENAFTQRLDDPETGVIIIVMQRLHERDLSGHILSQNLGYTHLKIPGEFRRPMVFHFPLSERKVECQEGTALHPERKSMARLEKQKRELGHHGYSAQILQEPEARGGGILKAEKHIRFWHHRKADPPKEYPTAEVSIIPSEMDKEVQSWDLTFKDKKKSDFVVGQVWGKVKANCYLKDQVNDRMSFTASKEALKRMTLRYPDTKEKYVEDAANGPALQDDLKSDIPGIILVTVNGMSKSERLYATEYLWDAGNVWLPHPEIAPWILDYLSNVLAFPRSGVPDDEVDATTQALIRLNGKPKIKTDINMDLGSLTRASPWST
jgi:predicted phage terminase large subunit-like protein